MPARNRPDEVLALHVLQQYAPIRYAHALHADRPDIWCLRPSIGVEVTWGYANHILAQLGLNSARDPHDALLRYHSQYQMPFADRTGRAFEYLEANGTIDRNIEPPAHLGSGNDMLFAYRRKVAKAHQYRQFAEMNLFLHIFPTTDDEVRRFAASATELARRPVLRTVYCYDGRTLWVVDLMRGIISHAEVVVSN
ncbi:hypothetical protein [Lacticaseibacillus pantheris]|uniref:hypothetical protein n=1 Tax=Lacticaseibacillus pantheris TaxID=171523 RepID=UPI00265B3F27|nr:hypothetical protein [Lacticaseibacillus pantheris]WKF85254.1 hypothetical protein QY874_01180 [Lacticaseibacillus pantheris]